MASFHAVYFIVSHVTGTPVFLLKNFLLWFLVTGSLKGFWVECAFTRFCFSSSTFNYLLPQQWPFFLHCNYLFSHFSSSSLVKSGIITLPASIHNAGHQCSYLFYVARHFDRIRNDLEAHKWELLLLTYPLPYVPSIHNNSARQAMVCPGMFLFSTSYANLRSPILLHQTEGKSLVLHSNKYDVSMCI